MWSRMLGGALALVSVAVLAAGCFRNDPPPVDRLVIATGGDGGVYYAVGQALAAAAQSRWATDARVLVTAASVENLQLLADGRADVGFATVDSAALARTEDTPFPEPVPIAAVAGLYDDYLHIVVSAEGGIDSVADLRGRRVSTGSPRSGTEIVAARILGAVRIDPTSDIDRHRLSATESADALYAGEIDAFFFTGGLPTPAIAGLAERMPIRLLSVGEEIGTLQHRYGEYYQARSIPAALYGLEGEVATLGIANVLLVRADMPEEVAYQLTGLLFAAKGELVSAHAEARRLDRRSALATFPIPLHPGAARYYREAKQLTMSDG